MARAKVVEHTKTTFPEVDQQAINEQNETEEDLSPAEQAFTSWISSMGAGMKAKVFRITADGQAPVYLGSISPTDIDPTTPEESIKSRWGGGTFQLRVNDNGTEVTIGPLAIDGPPKAMPPQPQSTSTGVNVNLPPVMPGQADNTTLIGIMLQSQQNMMQLMQQAAENNNKLLVKMVEVRQPHESPQVTNFKETLEIVKLLQEDRRKIDWEKWIDIGSIFLERLAPILGGGAPSEGVAGYVLQQLLPNLKNIADSVAERFRQPQALGNAVGAEVDIHPNLIPSQKPQAQPAPATSEVPGLPPVETRMKLRAQFEHAYLQKLLNWALDPEMDAYTAARSFETLVPDTRVLLPLINIADKEEFYRLYPQTCRTPDVKEWFDELFGYIMDPSLGPPVEEPEDLQVVVEPEPKNGKARKTKGAEA